MHIDFALPKDHDLEKGFQEYQQKVKKSVMDYSLHMAVTRFDDKVNPFTTDIVLLESSRQKPATLSRHFVLPCPV